MTMPDDAQLNPSQVEIFSPAQLVSHCVFLRARRPSWSPEFQCSRIDRRENGDKPDWRTSLQV